MDKLEKIAGYKNTIKMLEDEQDEFILKDDYDTHMDTYNRERIIQIDTVIESLQRKIARLEK